MKIHHRRRVPWSELPLELLIAIAERLETRADILHFRRVCKTWRSSSPLSLLTSKNILSPLFPHNMGGNKVLVATSIFLVRSAVNPKLSPWLVTVEESNPGKLCIRVPLSRLIAENLPEDFPEDLNLSQFNVSELARFYTYKIVDKNSDDCSSDCAVKYYDDPVLKPPLSNKVVLFVNPNCNTSSPKAGDCALVELSNHGVARIEIGENHDEFIRWGKFVFEGRRSKFVDIVNYKGRIYALDCFGRLWSLDYHSLKMLSIVKEVLIDCMGSDTKKRLAVSCGELYFVYTRQVSIGFQTFKVYKLNEEEKKWDMLEGIGNDRILFVTFDGCFFASAKDFPRWRGNCIVSPKDSFYRYLSNTFSSYDKVSDYIIVYHFEGGGRGPTMSPIDSCPSYSEVLWPPPSWLWTNACLVTCEEKDGKDGQEKEDGEDEVEEDGEDEVEEDGEDEVEEDGEKLNSDSPSQIAPDLISEEEMSPNNVQVTKGTQNVLENVAHEEFKNQANVDSAPAVNSPLKCFEKDISQSKFLGVDVSSHLVPILQKIWTKHGNITEGHVVTSNYLLTWALESLAKIIIILQSDPGRSLDDSQAKYLKSTIRDLQLMGFKLDWLVPFVEKALLLHKNKVIMELEMAKSKLQTELREVEGKLAEQGELAPESQLVSASLYLKDVLS
ncbi:hypothetical protein SOVF_145890 [Spinacia oleracea]|uniref:F-box protein SKIP23 n=1 Tax=Spinacia oleracea TaxID=3562 RepID=A0A9R0JH13_SPIOL|nr:F-box protein SKIP23-like [Spinacia oleracea]KNA10272.1 hypothetical protein SOVF_145890 [Spinacia oleracea]